MKSISRKFRENDFTKNIYFFAYCASGTNIYYHMRESKESSKRWKVPSLLQVRLYIRALDIRFLSNRNIHKSSNGLFCVSDPLSDRFYYYLSIKGSEDQKQRPHKLLWVLWFDEKSISTEAVSRLLRGCQGEPSQQRVAFTWTTMQVSFQFSGLFGFCPLRLSKKSYN